MGCTLKKKQKGGKKNARLKHSVREVMHCFKKVHGNPKELANPLRKKRLLESCLWAFCVCVCEWVFVFAICEHRPSPNDESFVVFGGVFGPEDSVGFSDQAGFTHTHPEEPAKTGIHTLSVYTCLQATFLINEPLLSSGPLL